MNVGKMMNMIKQDECPVMRMMRKSSELRRYYLEKERQAMYACTSFKDTLQAFAENGKSTVEGIASDGITDRVTQSDNVPPIRQGHSVQRALTQPATS